jgi:histone H1/5
MVGKAISALKERGGSSRQAILKYIMANFNVGKDAKSVNAHLKLSLRAGVKNKSLKQSKGTGVLGLLLLLYLPFFFANNPSEV